MHLNSYRKHSRAPLVVAALLCSACSFRGPLTQHAVDYNLAIERAQNKILLLNVIRSMEQRPRYYSAFSKITGKIIGTFAFDASIPVGKDAMDIFTLSPKFSIQSGPTFDIAPLDTHLFTRGLMTPVAASTFKYYRDQGWPRELLLFLFVRRVELSDLVGDPPRPPKKRSPGEPKSWNCDELEKRRSFVNDPGNRDDFEAFQSFVACNSNLKLVPNGKPDFSFEVKADDSIAILEAAKRGLTIEKTPSGKVRISLPEREYSFTCEGCTDIPSQGSMSSSAPDPEDMRLLQPAIKFTAESTDADNSGAQLTDDREKSAPSQVEVYLRSPEAIVYYLGELARKVINDPEFEAPVIPARPESDDDGSEDLFAIRRTRLPALLSMGSQVSIRLGGYRYYIPASRDQAGRSMHCLTLVAQLIGLQKESSELPTTQTVITAN
jgi:hypothetical protein